MAGRGRRRCRGGARSRRGQTRSNLNFQKNSSNGGGQPPAIMTEEEATAEELSDFLSQPPEILVQIVNYLDPKSLRELAFTCRSLYHFCVTAKGINVVLPVNTVSLLAAEGGRFSAFYHSSLHLDDGIYCEAPDFEKYLKKLSKWPFSIHIDTVQLEYLNRNFWNELMKAREFFERNGVKKIRSCSWDLPMMMEEVELIASFVKVFEIESIRFDGFYRQWKNVAEACLQIPVTELHCRIMTFSHGDLDVDFLANCSIPILEIEAKLTMAGMDMIMQIWKSRDGLQRWKFFHRMDSTAFMEYFNLHEIRSFTYPGPIDRNNPPVFLHIADDHQQRREICFYILRRDGKVICVSLDIRIEFRMCPVCQGPLALRGL